MSPLAATTLLLVAMAAGTVVWLAVTGPASDPDGMGPAAVTVALAPVAEPAATPAATPAGDPPAPAAADAPPSSPRAEESKPAGGEASENGADGDSSPPGNAQAGEAQTAVVRTLPPPADGLARAPDPSLLEPSRFGQLPRVAPDGRKAWQVYARPFDANDQRPRISIIVSGLGLSSAATEAAIQRLPGPVTVAFSPYARGLDQWIALARAAGHEVLMDLPMEPVNFPASDPGPETLLTSLTSEQNRTRLHMLLSRVTGYVGVVNQMGSRFTTSAPHLRPVLSELRDRGLLFVDSRSSLRLVAARTASELQLPRVINNRFIDAEASRDAIDARLQELERIARISGYAVGIAQPFPVTIDRLMRWSRDLEEKGFALAPVSAMVNVQPD